MDLQIRQCEIMDAKAIHKLNVREMGYDYDVIYAPHLKNIMGIAVSSDFKKRGVGRALLSAIEDWARKDGACGVRFVSGMARTGAHEFYRHCGYGGDKQQINFKKMF